MASTVTTTVHLEDDMSGGKADETINFAVNGQAYEIDLNKVNAKKFHSSLKPFIDAARKVGGPNRAKKSRNSGPDAKAVRAWAKSARIKVPERGRVPGDVIERYLAAR